MLRAFGLEHDRIKISHVVVGLLDVQYVGVGWQIGYLLSHLVGIVLLVVIETRDVHEREHTELARLHVPLNGELALDFILGL